MKSLVYAKVKHQFMQKPMEQRSSSVKAPFFKPVLKSNIYFPPNSNEAFAYLFNSIKNTNITPKTLNCLQGGFKPFKQKKKRLIK